MDGERNFLVPRTRAEKIALKRARRRQPQPDEIIRPEDIVGFDPYGDCGEMPLVPREAHPLPENYGLGDGHPFFHHR